MRPDELCAIQPSWTVSIRTVAGGKRTLSRSMRIVSSPTAAAVSAFKRSVSFASISRTTRSAICTGHGKATR